MGAVTYAARISAIQFRVPAARLLLFIGSKYTRGTPCETETDRGSKLAGLLQPLCRVIKQIAGSFTCLAVRGSPSSSAIPVLANGSAWRAVIFYIQFLLSSLCLSKYITHSGSLFPRRRSAVQGSRYIENRHPYRYLFMDGRKDSLVGSELLDYYNCVSLD